jgi:hypothetical protein
MPLSKQRILWNRTDANIEQQQCDAMRVLLTEGFNPEDHIWHIIKDHNHTVTCLPLKQIQEFKEHVLHILSQIRRKYPPATTKLCAIWGHFLIHQVVQHQINMRKLLNVNPSEIPQLINLQGEGEEGIQQTRALIQQCRQQIKNRFSQKPPLDTEPDDFAWRDLFHGGAPETQESWLQTLSHYLDEPV